MSCDGRDRIPFNRPFVAPATFDRIREAVANLHLSGDGPLTRRCHALLAEDLGGAPILLTTSCTHALELAALLLAIEPGDEIIVPSFTFVATVNAFVLHGARPVFVDIRADTLNLDERLIEAAITPRTKAIIVVHYAGIACEMDAVLATAERHGIPVVEDNAHGLFGAYRGRPLGTFGRLATLSFHETKNVSCGEGGALVVNDRALLARAEVLREKGTDRSRFFRGEVDKYGWVDVGSSWLPSEILAAVLLAQLEMRQEIQRRRAAVWNGYRDALADWAGAAGIRLPVVPAHCTNPYHLFYLVLPSLAARQALIAHLGARGIHAVFHYLPLHRSTMGRRVAARGAHCPVTESVSDGLVRLPFYNEMTSAEHERVVAAVRSFSTAGG
jgi:dTDP-4-amino-4,6-dideoxygalactose transaminase